MKVKGKDITMIRGDSEVMTVSCVDTDGVAIPLVTGDIIYFTVKQSTGTLTKELQKVITEFTDGKAIIEIIPSDTKLLNFRQYVYDIQLTKANGTVTTIIPSSKFTIEPEVTYE